MRAVPLVGASRQVNMRMVVVLPAPFGPRNPKIRPRGTVSERLSTATTSPPHVENRLVRFSISIMLRSVSYSTTESGKASHRVQAYREIARRQNTNGQIHAKILIRCGNRRIFQRLTAMKKFLLRLAIFDIASMSLLAQPTIPQPLTNQALAAGATLTLRVKASDPLATYQWFKDSRLLLGATNPTLKVVNSSMADSGAYYVVVTNAAGMVISLPALVAVGNGGQSSWSVGQRLHDQHEPADRGV